uniref:Ricin B lectin domain-containing protein n=1 Tax=Psilocybe cubensis TaxID=181762 RepID=A0A8H7XWY7_PSICU
MLYIRIQNVASGTYLDLLNGSSAPGTQVHGWASNTTETQDWFLRRVSRTDVELRAILAKDIHNAPNFQGFTQDGLYLVLPQSVRDAIYVKSGLKTMKGRGQLFDSDDYAIVLKAEVAKWGIATLLADDFGILWGLIFGTTGNRSLAYNFYLNENLDNIVFFDPYTGEEKVDMGYKTYMAVY